MYFIISNEWVDWQIPTSLLPKLFLSFIVEKNDESSSSSINLCYLLDTVLKDKTRKQCAFLKIVFLF